MPAPPNAPKILAAPVTVIVAHDLDFVEQLPKLFPAARRTCGRIFPIPWSQKPPFFAYVIIAARALGLDCGPMSGFSKEAVDSELFANTHQIQFHLLHRLRIE